MIMVKIYDFDLYCIWKMSKKTILTLKTRFFLHYNEITNRVNFSNFSEKIFKILSKKSYKLRTEY